MPDCACVLGKIKVRKFFNEFWSVFGCLEMNFLSRMPIITWRGVLSDLSDSRHRCEPICDMSNLHAGDIAKMPLRCRLLYWACRERAHSLAGRSQADVVKTAQDFTQFEGRVLKQGGAESAAFSELKVASIHIPDTEKQWLDVSKHYGATTKGTQNWRTAAPKIAKVRQEFLATVDAAEWASFKLRPEEKLLDYLIRRSKQESSQFTDPQYRAGRPQGSCSSKKAGIDSSKDSGAGAFDRATPATAKQPRKTKLGSPELVQPG